MLSAAMEPLPNSQSDPLRELFEACKTGDIARVRKLITPQTVNARDTAGRKSTPLHFAAGTLHSWAFFTVIFRSNWIPLTNNPPVLMFVRGFSLVFIIVRDSE